MQIYSAYPRPRARQLAADATALAAIVLSALVGCTVGALVGSTASLGRGLEGAGEDFAGTMTDASDALGGIPLLGGAAASPFAQASAAGAALAQAGRDQQALINGVSVALGLLIALLPIAIVLLVWLRRRVAFARGAAEIKRVAAAPGGLELLAVRALTTADAATLLALGGDVVQGWRAAHPPTIRALAELALRDAGVAPVRVGS
ncbi:hypothetical protein HQQ81_13865 [Microbacteriaceae bacterium VKM Ac-2854]|nr:hypothetical protein [Microbacteriaceae bacterium VKM Ac-2854]